MKLPVLMLFAAFCFSVTTANAAVPKDAPAAVGAVPSAGDQAAKRALVDAYVTEARFGPLYQKVLAQYTGFVPSGKQAQAEAMVDNPDFRDRIFSLVRDQLVATYTLEELKAKATFLQTPEGKGIIAKVNEEGMSFRNKDLSPEELQALREFDATPVGQSIVQKSPGFVSRLLSQVFKTFLIYQTSL